MEFIPSIALIFIENIVVNLLFGASTLAVISYALCLKYGYPKEGIGHHLIQSIYTLIRLFHIFFTIIVVILIIVYGALDGVLEVQVEYGVKIALLLINGFIAFGMSRRMFPVRYAAPVIAAGWYFVGTYHIYAMNTVFTSILAPIIWYLSFVIAFQALFCILHYAIKPAKNDV